MLENHFTCKFLAIAAAAATAAAVSSSPLFRNTFMHKTIVITHKQMSNDDFLHVLNVEKLKKCDMKKSEMI